MAISNPLLTSPSRKGEEKDWHTHSSKRVREQSDERVLTILDREIAE